LIDTADYGNIIANNKNKNSEMRKDTPSNNRALRAPINGNKLLAHQFEAAERIQQTRFENDAMAMQGLCEEYGIHNYQLFLQKFYAQIDKTIQGHPGACAILVFAWFSFLKADIPQSYAMTALKLWCLDLESKPDPTLKTRFPRAVELYHDFPHDFRLKHESKSDEKVMRKIFTQKEALFFKPKRYQLDTDAALPLALDTQKNTTIRTVNTPHGGSKTPWNREKFQTLLETVREKIMAKPEHTFFLNLYGRYNHSIGFTYSEEGLTMFDPNRIMVVLPQGQEAAFFGDYMAKTYEPANVDFHSAALCEASPEVNPVMQAKL